MKAIYPAKLKTGDEIRVVSPASSMSMISEETQKVAKEVLEGMGLRVSYSKNAMESDAFTSSSIRSRVDDLQEAFLDPNVKAIFATIGGFNSNQLLKYLDYDLIKNNPKILCGFSDITALQHAIFAKTGLVTYSGPVFATLGMKKGNSYTLEYLKKCLMSEEPFKVDACKEWSDDKWYKDQENREFISNEGPFVIHSGEAEGVLLGANLCTLNLLQGTEFMPDLQDGILFLEDDYEITPELFDRDLQSLLHLPAAKNIKGIVIGRFQKATNMTRELLEKIINSKEELKDLPVIADVDFGHTSPLITFPIGGKVRIKAADSFEIEILEH